MGIHAPATPAVNISGYPLNILNNDNAYVTDSIYPTWIGNANGVDDSISANYIYGSMLIIKANVTATDICFENTGTGDSGDDIRCGLWTSSAVGYPSSLLQETGETALDGTADVRVASIPNQALTPGVYWLGMVSNATVNVSMTTFGLQWPDTSFGNVIWNGRVRSKAVRPGFYVAATYGALPAISSPVWYSKGPTMGIKVA